MSLTKLAYFCIMILVGMFSKVFSSDIQMDLTFLLSVIYTFFLDFFTSLRGSIIFSRITLHFWLLTSFHFSCVSSLLVIAWYPPFLSSPFLKFQQFFLA